MRASKRAGRTSAEVLQGATGRVAVVGFQEDWSGWVLTKTRLNLVWFDDLLICVLYPYVSGCNNAS